MIDAITPMFARNILNIRWYPSTEQEQNSHRCDINMLKQLWNWGSVFRSKVLGVLKVLGFSALTTTLLHFTHGLLTACLESIKGIPIEFFTFISLEFQFDILLQQKDILFLFQCH